MLAINDNKYRSEAIKSYFEPVTIHHGMVNGEGVSNLKGDNHVRFKDKIRAMVKPRLVYIRLCKCTLKAQKI
jgi:hypothetical protein